ncbi:MAG: hypothetical protein ABH875_04570, partial [Candidatus Omnitrophota bacterium]
MKVELPRADPNIRQELGPYSGWVEIPLEEAFLRELYSFFIGGLQGQEPWMKNILSTTRNRLGEINGHATRSFDGVEQARLYNEIIEGSHFWTLFLQNQLQVKLLGRVRGGIGLPIAADEWRYMFDEVRFSQLFEFLDFENPFERLAVNYEFIGELLSGTTGIDLTAISTEVEYPDGSRHVHTLEWLINNRPHDAASYHIMRQIVFPGLFAFPEGERSNFIQDLIDRKFIPAFKPEMRQRRNLDFTFPISMMRFLRILRFIPYINPLSITGIGLALIFVVNICGIGMISYSTPAVIIGLIFLIKMINVIQWMRIYFSGDLSHLPREYERPDLRAEWDGYSDLKKAELIARDRWVSYFDSVANRGGRGFLDSYLEVMTNRETLGYKHGDIYTGMSREEWDKLPDEDRQKTITSVRHYMRWGYIIPRLREFAVIWPMIIGAYFICGWVGMPIWSAFAIGIGLIVLWQKVSYGLLGGRGALSYPALWNVFQPTLTWLFAIPVLQAVLGWHTGFYGLLFYITISPLAQLILLIFSIFMLRAFMFSSMAVVNKAAIERKQTFTVRYDRDIKKVLRIIGGGGQPGSENAFINWLCGITAIASGIAALLAWLGTVITLPTVSLSASAAVSMPSVATTLSAIMFPEWVAYFGLAGMVVMGLALAWNLHHDATLPYRFHYDNFKGQTERERGEEARAKDWLRHRIRSLYHQNQVINKPTMDGMLKLIDGDTSGVGGIRFTTDESTESMKRILNDFYRKDIINEEVPWETRPMSTLHNHSFQEEYQFLWDDTKNMAADKGQNLILAAKGREKWAKCLEALEKAGVIDAGAKAAIKKIGKNKIGNYDDLTDIYQPRASDEPGNDMRRAAEAIFGNADSLNDINNAFEPVYMDNGEPEDFGRSVRSILAVTGTIRAADVDSLEDEFMLLNWAIQESDIGVSFPTEMYSLVTQTHRDRWVLFVDYLQDEGMIADEVNEILMNADFRSRSVGYWTLERIAAVELGDTDKAETFRKIFRKGYTEFVVRDPGDPSKIKDFKLTLTDIKAFVKEELAKDPRFDGDEAEIENLFRTFYSIINWANMNMPSIYRTNTGVLYSRDVWKAHAEEAYFNDYYDSLRRKFGVFEGTDRRDLALKVLDILEKEETGRCEAFRNTIMRTGWISLSYLKQDEEDIVLAYP